jgi:hypothetical protein
MKRISIRLFVMATTLGGALSAPQAMAQVMPGAGLAPTPKPASEAPSAQPPPPAIPGARTDKEMVAPAQRLPADLSPNDALFDAINRGDIAAARDALNRGADLNARSVLGMTPLELSIDLGRKDISFLLLSMRGASTSTAAKAAPTKTAEVEAPKPAKVRKAERRPPNPERVAAPPAPQTPRLFAGDGGTPVPSAGFLGFGANGGSPR